MSLIPIKEASEILKISKPTLTKHLRSGKIAGRFIGSKGYMEVEDSLIEAYNRSKVGVTPQKPEAEPDELAKIQRETAIARAVIERDETIGKRDKPAILAERAAELDRREEAIESKEEAIEAVEIVKAELRKLTNDVGVAFKATPEPGRKWLTSELVDAFNALNEYIADKNSMFEG